MHAGPGWRRGRIIEHRGVVIGSCLDLASPIRVEIVAALIAACLQTLHASFSSNSVQK